MVKVIEVLAIEDDGKTVFQVFLDNGKSHIGDTERENVPEVGAMYPNMNAFYGSIEK